MKLKNVILLSIGAAAFLQPLLRADEEGFTFTEEEVAAFEEEARKIESILHNEAEYKRACSLEYNRLIMIIGNCFRAFGKSQIDFADCADERPLAAIHKQYADVLISQFGVIPATGQTTKGAFTRANLIKAKPYLSAATYASIEADMTRAEIMLKFYMGGFAKACALFTEDFYEEVQSVARLGLLIESSEFKEIDSNYLDIWNYFKNTRPFVDTSLEQYVDGGSRPDEIAIKFLTAYGKDLSFSERNTWYASVLDEVPDSKGCQQYVNIREEGCSYTAEAATLSNYERLFTTWTKDRIKSTVEWGKLVKEAFESSDIVQEDAAYKEAATNGPQDIYAQTYQELCNYMGSQVFKMPYALYELEDYLNNETKYLENMEKSNGKLVLDNAKLTLEELRDTLKHILILAVKDVPKNHPATNEY